MSLINLISPGSGKEHETLVKLTSKTVELVCFFVSGEIDHENRDGILERSFNKFPRPGGCEVCEMRRLQSMWCQEDKQIHVVPTLKITLHMTCSLSDTWHARSWKSNVTLLTFKGQIAICHRQEMAEV